jgi:putative transposase
MLQYHHSRWPPLIATRGAGDQFSPKTASVGARHAVPASSASRTADPQASRGYNLTTPMSDSPPLPRRRSIRLPSFDYSHPGSYFVTILSHDARHIFGELILGQMRLSAIGQIVSDCWLDVPNHFSGIELSEHIIMPNHLHGIVRIPARARHAVPLPRHADTVEAFGVPRAGSMPTIVRSFKSAVSQRARKALGRPDARIWQRNYFERVIRNEKEFHKARHYIAQNPARWEFENDKLDEPYIFDL